MIQMKPLHRYWFTFAPTARPTPLNLGCGVTAYTYEDALTLLQERVFPGSQMPSIASAQTDPDVSTLDKRHVLPNMGSTFERGIWFPLGF